MYSNVIVEERQLSFSFTVGVFALDSLWNFLLIGVEGCDMRNKGEERASKRASEADATNESATSLRSSLAAQAYRLRFFPKCGRQKRLEQKILPSRLAAAGYGGAGFQLVRKFL